MCELENLSLRRQANGDNQRQGCNANDAANHHEPGAKFVPVHHPGAVTDQAHRVHWASCKAIFGSITRSSATMRPRSMRAIRWQWFAISASWVTRTIVRPELFRP